MTNIFTFLDIELREKESTSIGTCPFCESENKFFADIETTKYECKKCGESGNNYTLITKLHAKYLKDTTDKQLQVLAKERKLPLASLKTAKVAYNDGKYYIPFFRDDKGKNLANLGITSSETKWKIFKAPKLPLYIYNPIPTSSKPIEVFLEGEWDALAALTLFQESSTVRGIPGATTFKEDWIPKFDGKEVIILYDNDDAGKKGAVKVCKMLGSRAKSISYLNWVPDERIKDCNDPSKPGKDIRDLMNSSMNQEEISKYILENQKIPTEAQITSNFSMPKTYPVKSWDELIGYYRKWLYMTESAEASLACCFTSIISCFLPGEPLWFFLIGPASSGKTTLIEAFGSGNKYCESRSKLTHTQLVSGYKDNDESDPSLFAIINRRLLAVKDWTTIIEQSHASQAELYSILRDAFDGKYTSSYGNRVSRNYDALKFGFIAGVTEAIYRDSKSSLGERFLKIHFLDPHFDEIAHIKTAMRGRSNKEERTQELEAATLGFLDHLVKNLNPSKFPKLREEDEDAIIELAMFVSILRTNVERSNRDESLQFRPSKEIGARLASQFSKMAEVLMYLFNQDSLTDMVYNILKQVAIDTCIPFNIELLSVLHKYSAYGGATREQIRTEMNLPRTNIHRIISDLQQLGFLISTTSDRIAKGRPNELCRFNNQITSLWDTISQKGKPYVSPYRHSQRSRKTKK